MWLALVLFSLIGMSLGVFGGGGSILGVPALVYALGVEPKPAIATSLLVVGLTSVTALVPHARQGNVRWRSGMTFGLAGMVGAYAGGRVAAYVPGPVLLLLFGGMMLVTSAAMWRGRAAPAPRAGPRPLAPIALLGLLIGAFTGLVGAGGGFLVVPALVLLLGLPMAQAVGTSLLVISMKALAGYAGYAAHVPVDTELAFAVCATAALGSLVGARLTTVLHPDRLRRGFAVFVFVMGLVVLWQEAGPVLAAMSGS